MSVLSGITILMLFLTAVESASMKGQFHCVRISKVREEIVNTSVILKVDYKPIRCPHHFILDNMSEQQGLQSLESNTAIFNETNVDFDPRYFQEGTEIAILVNTGLSRSKRAIALAPLFYSFGALLFTAISVWVIQTSTTNLSPVYVSHRPKDDPNGNYLEQLRLQEVKDAENKIKKLIGYAQEMDPTQVAPAKKSGKRGEWCTAIQSKAISLNDNYRAGQNAAQGVGIGIGPGGNGPTPPPTPNWSKGTPAPKIAITENPRKRKQNEPFIQDPKRTRPSIVVDAVVHENFDVEVVNLIDEEDDDIVYLGRSETVIRANPGSNLVVSSRTCRENTGEDLGYGEDFREAQLHLVQDPVTLADSDSDSSGVRVIDPDLSLQSRVIAELPEIRARLLFPTRTQNQYAVADQWRGNQWGSRSDPIENTCIMDSFLSHVIYISRRNPNYFYQVMRLIDDQGERALRNVIRTGNSDDYSVRQRSNLIHEHWVSAFPEVFTKVSQNGRHVDVGGSEEEAIIGQLRNSSALWIAHQCNCPNSEPGMLSIRSGGRRIPWNPQTLSWFQSTSFPAPDTRKETESFNLDCNQCLLQRRPVRGFIAESTWVHNFFLSDEDVQDASVFDWDSYPRTLVFEELGTGNTVYFDIGYFSISTPFTIVERYNARLGRMERQAALGHQTSVHFIEGMGWMYYDGMDFSLAGQLREVPEALHKKKVVRSVTYFRRVEHRRNTEL